MNRRFAGVGSLLLLLIAIWGSVSEICAQGGPLRIQTSALPEGTFGVPYSFTMDGAGGTTPYRWAASGLPSPLTIGPTSGQITGTPAVSGTFTVTVTISDVTNASVNKNFTLIVRSALAIGTTSLASGTVGALYSETLTASGGTTPYTWAVTSGSLPPGLGPLGATTGVISGTPSSAGTSNFTITVTDSAARTAVRDLSITIQPATPVITTSSLPAGVVGAAYSQTLAASGGTAPYTWAVTSGSLPPGLGPLGATTGVISGTPSSAGTSNFTITVTDSAARTAVRDLSITIQPATLVITTSSLPAGVVGAAYSQTLAASGGTAPYTWAVTSGSLPPGLGPLGATTGVISGTPSSAGTSNFTITVTDSAARTAVRDLSITIQPVTLVITTSSLPAGVVGAAYSQTLAASGGTAPYTWAVTSGSLPPGLGPLGATTGVISGTPSSAGTSNFTITVTDSAARTAVRDLSITIQPATLVITTSSLPAGVVGAAYSQTLAASGGTAPYTWAVTSGSLPPGLGPLGATTGVISGTPSSAGTSNFTITVTDSAARTAVRDLSITIQPATLVITTSSLPAGVVGAAYSQTLAASGGTAPYTWAVTSGSLPPGLGPLGATTGVISGTPSSAGTSNFTITVTDSAARTAVRDLSITIQPATLVITTSSLPAGVVGAAYSQTLAASGGTAPYTWAVTSGSLPPGLGPLGATTGVISGTPSSAGTSNFTITVTDSAARTAVRDLSITIQPVTLVITTSSLPAGVVGAAYSQTLAASGGTAPYTWAVTSGSLPPGLGPLGATTGVISGTPSSAGTSNFTITVTDSAARTAVRDLSITIQPVTLVITTSSLPAGVVGAAYSQTLAASGGTAPYTWAVTSGSLPPGLGPLGATTGVISGTPSSAGTSNFTITVTDSAARTAVRDLSITIQPVTLVITTSSLPAGVVGAAYSQTLAASGGTAPYTWAVTSGSLPPGLGPLGATTGVISGTPSSAGTSNFTITVTDSAARTAVRDLSITIQPATLVITTSSLPAGVVGAAYSQSLAASGGTAPYTWAVTSGSLPPGLGPLGATTGVISGTPSSAGTSNFTITVTDSAARTAVRDLSITIQPVTLVITTSSLPAGVVGAAYSQTLAASGGTAPYTWAVTSGSLPPGLGPLGATTGVISGTPSSAGTSNFTITVTDSAARTAVRDLSITIQPVTLVITTSSLPAGVVGAAYSQTLAASGGTAPYTWAVTSGSLPPGLGPLGATTGVISGTPSSAGTSNFTITVTDSAARTAVRDLSITIQPVTLVITTSSLPAGVVGAAYSQTLAASGGTAPYTWAVTSGSLPPGLGPLGATTGVISGTPSSAGTSNFTITVTDSAARTAVRDLSITIQPVTLVITTSSLPAGVVGAAYSQTLAASGGTAPYTWAVTSGSLPPGLGPLGATTGVISGTPSSAGTSNFTITVTDSAARTAVRDLSITIQPVTLVITTSSLPAGVVGAAYSQTLAASGGTAPYTWAVTSGSLPPGLGPLGATTGVISGTPSSAGTSNFTITVTDSAARTAVRDLSITIQPATPVIPTVPPFSITTASLVSGTSGVAYSQSLAATGGTTPYTWSVIAGSLPTGLELFSSGRLAGTPASAGTFAFTAAVTDGSSPPLTARRDFVIVVVAGLSISTASPLGNGAVGSAYNATLEASNGTPPYVWSVTDGALPPGLSLASNGPLAGTPTTQGNYDFTVQVRDDVGRIATKDFGIRIQAGLTITTAPSLPIATVGSRYSRQIQASFSGSLTWSISSGNLPPGLTLSSSGLVDGTPSAPGRFEFTIQVAGGTPTQTATQLFRVEVVAGLTITTAAALPDGTFGTGYSKVLDAMGGIPPYTWTNTGGSIPEGLSLNSSGAISGTPVRTGNFTFDARVSDSSGGLATGSFTISVVPASIGSLSLTGTSDTMSLTQQVPVGLSLSAPYPFPLTGSMRMAFTSNAIVPSDDPVVKFSTGGRTVNFTIPANTTSAVFPAQVLLSTGTVSGTIVLTASIDNGPADIPAGSITIRPTVAQITNVTAVRTNGGLRIQVTGYSPERRVTNVEFGFDVTTPGGVERVNLSRNVESEFDTWYKSPASTAFGSTFVFEQSFTVQGDTSMIQSVTIRLTNGEGTVSSNAIPITSN